MLIAWNTCIRNGNFLFSTVRLGISQKIKVTFPSGWGTKTSFCSVFLQVSCLTSQGQYECLFWINPTNRWKNSGIKHDLDSYEYELDELRELKKEQDDSPLAEEDITDQIKCCRKFPFKEICKLEEEALFSFVSSCSCKFLYNYAKTRWDWVLFWSELLPHSYMPNPGKVLQEDLQVGTIFPTVSVKQIYKGQWDLTMQVYSLWR